jgi:N6-adenosine-specific RNA methylase IME4
MLSDKKYQVIYADPPWPNTRNDGNRAACRKFPLMSIKEIYSLPISQLIDENVILFLWYPTIFPQEALDVCVAWGFKFKTMGFVWIKISKAGNPLFGLGNYTRSNAELCLIGVKGKPKVISHSVGQVIMEPRKRFAEKPSIVRNKIVDLVGDLPRLELFARQKTEGWDTWGNEVENDVEL